MKPQPTETRTLDQRLPLLRAIQREIHERRKRLEVAEAMLEAFLPTRRHHADEVARLRSEISLQRRELRQIARELGRLDVPFDAEDPKTIVALAPVEPSAERPLDGTEFFRSLAQA